MRLLQYAIAILLWLVLGYFIKPCWESNCNGTSTTQKTISKAVAPTIKKVVGPLLFNWNKQGAITGDGWNTRRQALIDGLGKEDIFEITGNYRADETNNSSFENLGLARANEIAKLFKPPLTDNRIKLRSQLVGTGVSDKTSLFKSASFRNLRNSKSVKEIDDKTMIYFPFNSTNKLKNAEVEKYLSDVAKRVIKSGERVKLTGHTDNVDSDSFNHKLGMRRANIVKKYLLNKGVKANKIIAQSKGEKAPIATNSNSKGRAQNRRTELQIIK